MGMQQLGISLAGACLAVVVVVGCGSERGERSDPEPTPTPSLGAGLEVRDPHRGMVVCLHSGLIPAECPPATPLHGDRPQLDEEPGVQPS